ncbi:MAG TPA: hypothetical protein VGB87_14230 [Vicinamibacteria bacterium]
MPRARRTVALAAVLGLVAALAVAGPPDETSPREGIEALEAQLGRAVDRVSLPHATRLLGRVESARGYRLPGYGIVFVLAPRTLPGGEGQVYVFRDGAPRHRRVRVEPRGAGERVAVEAPDDVEVFERQVLVFQQEAEAARRAAEEEMEQLVKDVRVRVSPPTTVHVEVHEAPAPPLPPGAPAPPAAPEAPAPPAPPPWKFWFESGASREKRTPEALMADVRSALVDALSAAGGPVSGLAGDERVTVTVDFVPGGLFAAQARPEKTLVLSARVKDVNARARGAITAEELKKRVEVSEY